MFMSSILRFQPFKRFVPFPHSNHSTEVINGFHVDTSLTKNLWKMRWWPWSLLWKKDKITLEQLEPRYRPSQNSHFTHLLRQFLHTPTTATRFGLFFREGWSVEKKLSSGTEKARILWFEADFNSIFQPQQFHPSKPLNQHRWWPWKTAKTAESFGYLVFLVRLGGVWKRITKQIRLSLIKKMQGISRLDTVSLQQKIELKGIQVARFHGDP